MHPQPDMKMPGKRVFQIKTRVPQQRATGAAEEGKNPGKVLSSLFQSKAEHFCHLVDIVECQPFKVSGLNILDIFSVAS